MRFANKKVNDMKKVYYHLSIIPVRIESENPILASSGTLGAKINQINVTVSDFNIDSGFQSDGFKDASFGDGEISFM